MEDLGAIPILDTCLRLGVATLLGLLIGLDREIHGKAAGLRTHMLVALSSAATTLVSFEIYYSIAAPGDEARADPTRVVQGLAQAIGFISAGIIIKGNGSSVHNLTTATSLWMASAISIACGGGYFIVASLSAGLALIVLIPFGFVERKLFDRGKGRIPDRTA